MSVAKKSRASKPAAKKPAAKKPAAKKPATRAAVADVVITVQEGVTTSAEANRIRARAERMLATLGFGAGHGRSVEVSLALVDDTVIRQLNQRWRKKDKSTDVLSFPMHSLPVADLYAAASAAPLLLGDVVISLPTAEKQAKTHKRPPLDEITTLLAHGLLHLLGFDHKTDDQEREMNGLSRVLEAAAANKKPLRMALSPS